MLKEWDSMMLYVFKGWGSCPLPSNEGKTKEERRAIFFQLMPSLDYDFQVGPQYASLAEASCCMAYKGGWMGHLLAG